MNRKFKIEKEPYEEGQKIFEYNNLTIEEGINILVGCNGSRKSTLLNTIKYDLETNHIPVIEYDNLHVGGSSLRQNAVLDEDFYKLSVMIDVITGKTLKFDDYANYRQFVLNSRVKIDNR